MSTQPVLRLEGLTRRFGEFVALDGIDLDIEDGEFLTIVGPSGSGKTTLVRLLAGMEEPSSGRIWLRDERIDQKPANERPTCMVFQSLALFPHRTVGQNIEFPLKLRGEPQDRRRRRALELMTLLHLPEHYYARGVAECSGGERQRIALARALAFDPEILFFDEPLSALDYRLRKTLEKELKDLHERTGKTFVYITHSLEEAMVMSDRIAIMRAGRFEQIGVADEIYARPVSRFVAEFMGEVNLFPVTGTGNGSLRGDGIEVRADAAGLDGAFRLEAGREALLMVRPEFLRFVDSAGASDFTTTGTLRTQYVLGSRIHYTVETDAGSVLTVEKLREDRYGGAAGDRVVLGWDVDHSHLIRN